MRAWYLALFLCLAMFASIHCNWHDEPLQNHSRTEQQTDVAKQRVGRQLLSVQSPYQYVYYTDITMEGYNSGLYPGLLNSSAIVPYTLSINSTVSVSIVQIAITTECKVTATGKTCSCTAGYAWNITVCYSYAHCSNSSAFCTCLLVTDNDIPICEMPKNISDSKVFIKGSFTLNQTFTTDLLDPTSIKYKTMESNITLALLHAYTQNCNPLNVSVVGFSPGSVVANYKMALSGPLSNAQLSSSNTLLAQSLPVISSQISTTGVSSIDPSDLEVKFRDPIKITCEINETMTAVNWSLIINNVTTMIFSGGGNVNVSTRQMPGKTISILHVRNADQWWEGIYVCDFSNDSLVHKAKAVVNVTLLPSEIIVTPMQKSLTMQDTSQLLLECCVPFDGEQYNVSWIYSNITQSPRPGNRTDLRCYTLAPPRPANDTNYTCTFTNKAGQQKQASIPVTIISGTDKYCSIDVSYGVTWNVSKSGVSASASCPTGRSGYLTRVCSVDGVWLPVQDNCINQVLGTALNNIQAIVEGLGNPQVKVPQIIQDISSTNGTYIDNTADVSALVNILGTISRVASAISCTFDVNVVTSFLTLASNLTDTSYSSLWKSSNCPPASKVLQSVEQFSQLLNADNGTFEINLQNIQIKGSAYERGSSGQDYHKTFGEHLGVSMSINERTISTLLQESDVKITTVVFSSIGELLPSNTDKLNDTQLNSLVQSTSIRLSDSRSVSSDIEMSFQMNISDERYSQHCVFWDFSLSSSGGSWSNVGCTSRVVTNTTYCSCNHLTSFAVLMSINVEYMAVIEEITYAGLGVSILSLIFCVLIEWFVWKTIVRTNISYFRHISLVNIAISLLCADVCFLSSAFPSVIAQKRICLSITFLNHFFYLALFFWTFAQSVMLLHQLLFLFHHLRKRVYVSLSFFAGYFIPATIAAGTFLYFNPKGRYRHANVCWLNPETGAIYAFAIPAGSIIVFNLFTLLVVIAKLSRPSVSDASLPNDRDTAKSILKAILVLTPVFGLTWCFGFALLTDLDYLTKQIFTYGFAGMNAFQGFFILLTCITERKVREALFNKASSSPTSTTTFTSEAPSKTTSSIKKQK